MRIMRKLSGIALGAGAVLVTAPLFWAGVSPATAQPVRVRTVAQAPHVMTIMMENTDYSQFAGSPAMPFLNEMAREYADFTQAYGWHYPSLPNYLELLSGSREGVSGDCDITQPGCRDFKHATLVTQLEAAGISWNAYYQGDAFGCDQSDGGGNYPYWHNPFRYFANFKGQCSHISNFSDLLSNLSASHPSDFQWVVPDLVNSGGDNGTMSSGDSWLAGELPKIMSTNWYRQGGQIVILFDTGYEDSGGNGGASGGQIPMVVVSARTLGMGAISSPVNTAGVLRSIEHAYHLSYLGDAADTDNGSLGSAIVAGRPVGRPTWPSEIGAVLHLGSPAGPAGAGQSWRGPGSWRRLLPVPGTLVLNGLALGSASGPSASRARGQASAIAVGENSDGLGVVASLQAGVVSVPGTSNLESVSCVSETTCYAVGLAPSDDDTAVLVSIVRGRPTATKLLPAFIGLYGISCPSPTTCYAVGYDNADDADAVTTITAGVAGAPVEVSGGGEWLNAISCSSASTCYAAGLVNYNPAAVPIVNGTPGTAVTIPDAWYLNGIDCPRTGDCVVVGENTSEEGIVDTVSGTTAGTPQVVGGSEYLYGAGCAPSGDCVLTGAGTPGADGYSSALVAHLVDGTARAGHTIPGTNGFGQVVCESANECWSVGSLFLGPAISRW